MCLITDQQFAAVAEEDMVVYKALRGLDSPYQNFSYDLDKLYQTEIKKSDDFGCYDDQDEEALLNHYGCWVSRCRDGEIFAYGEGFHSVYNKERLSEDFWDSSIYECVIPKGSLYFDNPSGLIVSNQIIIKKRVHEIF